MTKDDKFRLDENPFENINFLIDEFNEYDTANNENVPPNSIIESVINSVVNNTEAIESNSRIDSTIDCVINGSDQSVSYKRLEN